MWQVVSTEDVIMKYEIFRTRTHQVRQDDQPDAHNTVLQSTPNKTTNYDQSRRSGNTDMYSSTASLAALVRRPQEAKKQVLWAYLIKSIN